MNSGKFTTTESFRLLVLATVATVVFLPVLINGIPTGNDLAHHFQCAMTYVESIRGSEFYPSWSANRNFGFGGMETRLYPPLSHYSLALAFLATGSWHVASWLIFTFFSFVGAVGVYLWAKESMSATNALFAGCLYAVMPYHLNQLYNTFFFAEFVGASLIPFTFLYIARVCRNGGLSGVGGLAVSFALLILTHLPLTVIGAVCFTVYALASLERDRILRQLTKLAAGVAVGLAASAFFWSKVVTDMNLMARATVYPEPMFDYKLNFLLTAIQSYDGIGVTVFENSTSFYDKMLFLPLIVVLVATVPFIVADRRVAPKLRGVGIVFAVATFLTLPFSSFLWRAFKPLQEIQFPWRFLTIVSLAAAILAASSIDRITALFKSSKRPFGLIVSGVFLTLIAYSAGQIIRPASYLEPSEITAFMAKAATGAGLEFWWPVDARKGFEKNAEKIAVSGRVATPGVWTATSKSFTVSAGAPEDARVAVFYHPNWRVAINDRESESQPRADADGALLVKLPADAVSVELKFVEPKSVTISRDVSATTWLALFAAFAGTFLIKKRKTAETAATDN